MSNPSVVTLVLAAATSNGYCLSQTPGGAGALTLNGSLVTGGVGIPDVPRRVIIASAGADTARKFTLTGTNRSGAPITETITGVNSTTTVQSVFDYKTLASVVVDAATAGAITVGTNGTGSTEWVLDSYLSEFWALSVAVSIRSGSATYTVEHTYDDPNTTTYLSSSMEPGSNQPPTVWSNPSLFNKTVNGEATYPNQPIFAHRLTITAGTGTVEMQSIQAGLGNRG